ncbi:EAL domain-containing protein [Colwellia sp. KU-HH00111]|uniref:EAL domain-containing protein n=1 Tax=Colwellia sp. KU-HH00111 TaxID=3127652 RepID=UPI0031047026
MFDFSYKSNISAKLNAFLVLPIITLLFFASITIYDRYQKLEQTEHALQFSQVIKNIVVVVYNLQKERGLSAGAMSINDLSFKLQLAQQRKITLAAYSKVSATFLLPPHYLSKKTTRSFEKIVSKFEKLSAIHVSVDNQVDNNYFEFYSDLISQLLQQINVLHAMVTKQQTNDNVSSLIYALGVEEYAAIERGLIYGVLNNSTHSIELIDNHMLINIVNHIARQQAELTRFYNVASEKHSTLMLAANNETNSATFQQYQKSTLKMLDKHHRKMTAAVAPISQSRQSAYYQEVLLSSDLWWQLATHRLKRLHQVSSTIIADIITLEMAENQKFKTPLVFYTLCILAVLAIVYSLTQVLKGRLVDKIIYIADFMRTARTRENDNKRLNISGQDEIAVMAKEFDLLMSERKKNEEQLKLAAQVFIEAHDGIFITQTDGTIIDVNPAFCKITGYKRAEILGKNPNILNSKKQNKKFYRDMWECLLTHGYWKGELWNLKKNGELYAELLTISSLKDNNGKTLHYMGLFSDITQIKNQNHTLEQMAHYDALTLLPNRTLFIDRFNQAIMHANRSKNSLAVCFIDLDKFKPINDNYGHEVGDTLLVEVAERIKSNLRNGDTVSRQGGDEFTLLLNDVGTFSDCEDILSRIHYSLAQPFVHQGVCHTITASTGVTLYPHDQGDLDTLIRHADHAMYQVKLSGGNGYRLFNKEQDQKIIRKQHKLNKIITALEQGEFTLYFQPKVNMRTGEVYGAEALIRWFSPENGLISPGSFLSTVEGTNVEIQLGLWVIETAIKQLAHWHQQGLLIEVSINISSFHLQSATFIEDLKNILAKYKQLDTRYIQLEILESSVLGDLNAINKTLNMCRELFELQIALDDFGTGYSSLTHIKSLPANTIKIDQSFVIDMLDDANNYSIINGVLSLAKSFSRDVIAEGVESTKHGLMLLMMGCDKAQGYGIARPMPANEFDNWLKSYQANKVWLAWANENLNQNDSEVKVFDVALQHEFSALSNDIDTPVLTCEDE